MDVPILRTASDVAEWVLASSTVALAVATLLVVVVALFQDQLRSLLRRPQLIAYIEGEPPDCQMITMGTGQSAVDAFYIRLRVANIGTVAAHDVEVIATELRMLDQSQTWRRVSTFLPMNLVWSHMWHQSGRPEIYFPMISPKLYKHCDLADVIDPGRRPGHIEDNPQLGLAPTETSMRFNVMVYPNHKGEIVGPGTYQLDLVVAASNVPPSFFVSEFRLSGRWYPSQAEMSAKGVGATIRPA